MNMHRQTSKQFPLTSPFGLIAVCIWMFFFVSFADCTGNEIDANLRWARQVFSDQPGAEPFSFVYNGQHSSAFLASWLRQVQEQIIDQTKLLRTLTLTDPATALEVKAVVTIYTDTPGVDWTLYFTNNGPADSLILEQVLALDVTLDNESAESPVLHRLKGSVAAADDWLPFDTSLSPNDSVEFGGINGRSSANCPFFNLQWGNQGVITAVGWSGQWQARVQYLTNHNLLIRTGMQYLHLKLHPGESIRTPRIMQLYWFTDHLHSYNLFRRTQFNHIMPRKQDGTLCVPPIAHLSTSFYELNGSNENNVLSHLYPLSGLGVEVFWLDAYYTKGGFPNGMGNYALPADEITPDPERFPNGLGPIRDAVHQEGMDFMLWFEPERVAGGTYIAENYPQYVISATGSTLGNNDYYILRNGNQILFNQLNSASDSPFNLSLDLAAGDTIDFAAGTGMDGGSNDTTPLHVIITKGNAAPSGNWTFEENISFTANPNGQWSYGSCPKATDPAHPDTALFQLYNDSYIQAPGVPWWHYDPKRTSEVPCIYHNSTGDTVYGCPAGMVALHPGTGQEEISITRWSAISQGDIHLHGTFYSGNTGRCDYYIIHNTSSVLFSRLDQSGDSSFDLILTVNPDDQIDFCVGTGTDGGSNDTTPLQAHIEWTDSQTWNLKDNISFTANPNQPWSYGSSPRASDPSNPNTSSFDIFNVSFIEPSSGVPWWHYDPPRPSLVPALYQNTTAGPIYSCPPGMVALHPGTDASEIAVARWTAPSNGTYNVTGTFYAGYSGGGGGGGGLFNLGLPEARQYMTHYLISAVHEFGLGVLRFDYNLNPLPYWQFENQQDPDRVGISEIRYMEGLYQMWDDIRQAYPNLLMDDCASGGMRIDLETMSRAIPLWRTDGTIGPLFALDFNQAALQNQLMTGGLSRYVPFHTSGMMGATPYWFRSGVNGGGISFCEDVRPETYPRDLLSQGIAEAKRIRRYYSGNFYPLTEITAGTDDWCVLQYHLPDKNKGMILAFRRQNSPDAIFSCRPREIDPNSYYWLHFYPTYDVAESVIILGADFNHLELNIDQIPGSLLIEYQKALAGDVSGDGYVDMLDLMMVASQWLHCTDPTNENCDL